MAKITLDTISNELAAHNWKVLSPEYKNLETLMTFECNEGHKVTNTWKGLRNKVSCPVCNSNKYINSGMKPIRKKAGVYRILAIDQSSKVNGYSIFDGDELVTYGIFETTKETALERMIDICEWLISMISIWKPDEVGFEETQYNAKSNHNTFKTLTKILGAAMITVARENVKVNTVLISTWRSHCKIKGTHRADKKRSAQQRVKEWYDISVSDDEGEAICIGKYFSEQYKAAEEVLIGEWI